MSHTYISSWRGNYSWATRSAGNSWLSLWWPFKFTLSHLVCLDRALSGEIMQRWWLLTVGSSPNWGFGSEVCMSLKINSRHWLPNYAHCTMSHFLLRAVMKGVFQENIARNKSYVNFFIIISHKIFHLQPTAWIQFGWMSLHIHKDINTHIYKWRRDTHKHKSFIVTFTYYFNPGYHVLDGGFPGG